MTDPMSRSLLKVLLLFVLVLGVGIGEVQAQPSAAPLEYNRDVRPILSSNCFPCHGTDSAARKDDLRIDRFDDAIKARPDSHPAIVPGRPDDSELVARIEDKKDPMPPEKSHKTLSSEQKKLLRRWVTEGAHYQPHWSFVAPVRPALPRVKDAGWVKTNVDLFVSAALEKQGLTANAEADRNTLVRRVSLDLTGLPPTPAEVDAFMADTSNNAYDKLVDRLLSSPRFGEHRAHYWLDAARYADTNGVHFDNFREIWAYRDWVVKAFNRNVAFDEFTIEQLAGDLLPRANMDQKIASGFNRCNITTNEGGAIDEEYLVLYARDRTETTAQVWLGLTAGCAVCHDHKYDPFSQKDFYSLSAFFNNTKQKAMDGNVADTAPVIVVPSKDDRMKWDALAPELNELRERLQQRTMDAKPVFSKWITTAPLEKLKKDVPSEDLQLHLPLTDPQVRQLEARVSGSSRTIALTTDAEYKPGAISNSALVVRAAAPVEVAEAGDFERDQGFSYAAWIKLSSSRDGAVFARMDDEHNYQGWDLWLDKGRPGTHIIHSWPGDALKVVARKALPNDRWAHVAVTYDGSSQLAGLKIYVNGELQEVEIQEDSLRHTIRTKVPFKLGQRHKTSQTEGTGLQDVRIFSRALSVEDVRRLANAPRLAHVVPKLAGKPWEGTPDGDESYGRWLVMFDKEFGRAKDEMALLGTVESFVRSRGTVAHIMSERETPAEAFVLGRGEYDKHLERVTAESPSALPPMGVGLPRTRLGLAKWLVAPENPLTARVTVNRFWQELFGVGLVRTTGDFGVSGEAPSHPELLDWLAVEFRESGWNIKSLFKLLVMSSAYRQSSVASREKIAKDPQNTWLSRGPRFRMDAEMVRDYALATSGLLVEKVGGASVKPYQPPGVWEAVAMPDSNTRQYKRDQGGSLYRRSVYTLWKRSAPPATMDIFNAPSREVCTVRRERTNTPLQALATLNDEQFVEAARVLAELAINAEQDDAKRINLIARRVLARGLTGKEAKIAKAMVVKFRQHYASHKDAADLLLGVGESPVDGAIETTSLAAYTLFANSVLNLDEALNK